MASEIERRLRRLETSSETRGVGERTVDAIFLVPVERQADGVLADGEPVLLWKREGKTDDET